MKKLSLDTHPAWMELDFDALRANLREVRRRVAPGVKIMASIKANAYGHGAVRVGHVLAELGVEYFATASFEDAVRLREAGITTPVVMFGGNLPDGIAAHLRHNLIPSVYNMETAELISRTAGGPTKVFLKVDIGLGRLGVPVDEAEAFVARVEALPNIVIEGLYSHIAFHDDETRAYARKRLPSFYRLVDRLAAAGIDIPVIQALGSSFILQGWTDELNAVCPGHLLYGISPCDPGYVDLAPFRPLLKGLKAQLIHVVRHPAAGPAPGESWSHKHRRGDTTGVIPLGLYDGYRKPAAGKGAEVLFRGRRIPVLGVSLEYTVLDLADFPDARLGEEVTLVGESAGVGESGGAAITLEEVAASLDISPLEFLMSLSGRLPEWNSVGLAEAARE